MNRFDEYSVDELKEALKTAMLYSDLNDDAVIEEMDEILAVLRKKAPFPHPHTTEEMWAEFQAEHADELATLGVRENGDTGEAMEKSPEVDVTVVRAESKPAKAKGLKPFLRVGLIAAIVVVLMLAITVTASAFGLNLWGWVPKWNREVMSFGGEEGEPNDLHDASPIAVMLSQLGIDIPVYPHWLPEGFEMETSVIETDPFFLHEGYSNGNSFISISIEAHDQAIKTLFQKDENQPLEYVINQQPHYITSDISSYTVSWQVDNILVQISGNISLDDMKRIIDSVYEVIE